MLSSMQALHDVRSEFTVEERLRLMSDICQAENPNALVTSQNIDAALDKFLIESVIIPEKIFVRVKKGTYPKRYYVRFQLLQFGW